MWFVKIRRRKGKSTYSCHISCRASSCRHSKVSGRSFGDLLPGIPSGVWLTVCALRALRKFQTKESIIGKLFAKHIKLEEAKQFLQRARYVHRTVHPNFNLSWTFGILLTFYIGLTLVSARLRGFQTWLHPVCPSYILYSDFVYPIQDFSRFTQY